MKYVIFLVLLFLSINSLAYDEQRALVNFSQEAAECSAYYLFSSEAPGLDENTRNKLKENYAAMFNIAIMSSNAEVSKARLELSIETMKREMNSNWSNMAIINNKYGYKCIDFANDVDGRLNYWLQKKDD